MTRPCDLPTEDEEQSPNIQSFIIWTIVAVKIDSAYDILKALESDLQLLDGYLDDVERIPLDLRNRAWDIRDQLSELCTDLEKERNIRHQQLLEANSK